MEDAAEALKLAFSVFVFIIALGLAFTTFNQSREVSDIVIARSDRTYLEAYEEARDGDDKGRIVGAEVVVPTLYRYYKENFAVDMVDKSGRVKELFDLTNERDYAYRNVKNSDTYKETRYDALYPDGVHWIGSKTDTDTKLRVDSYASQDERNINGYSIRPADKTFNFGKTYYQTFEEKYEGKKQAIEGTDDGTYFTVESGGTKIFITYKEN